MTDVEFSLRRMEQDALTAPPSDKQIRKEKRPRESTSEGAAFGAQFVLGPSLGHTAPRVSIVAPEGSHLEFHRPRESGRKAEKSGKGKKSKKRGHSKHPASSYSSSSCSSGSDSHGSVFREAKRWRAIPRTCAELLETHRTKPGRLGSETLQEMENRDGLGGERMTWGRHDRPASAQSYFLRVLKQEIGPSEVRDRRDSETLCMMMDSIALDRRKKTLGCLTPLLFHSHLFVVGSERWRR